MRPLPTVAAPPATESPSLAITQSHFSWLRTRLSIERTFMSWTRTAVSLIGFGFTIYKFLQEMARAGERPDAPRNFGLAFIATGVLSMAIGAWQRQVEIKHLNRPEYQDIAATADLPRWQWSNVVAVVVIAIGVVAFGWIVLNP